MAGLQRPRYLFSVPLEGRAHSLVTLGLWKISWVLKASGSALVLVVDSRRVIAAKSESVQDPSSVYKRKRKQLAHFSTLPLSLC